MPIYEFYCDDCHTVFNFFSKTVNTEKIPLCPKCRTKPLSRQISLFSVAGRAKESDDLPFDEGDMDRAAEIFRKEAGKINEDDPRQAANLMRKISDMTGMKLGDSMYEAMRRMEKGESPDEIEADMGDIMENEDMPLIPGKKGISGKANPAEIFRDETLYDL